MINKPGRKSIITSELIQTIKNLKENKKLPVTQIAKITKISRSTIYKILKEELHYTCRPARLIKPKTSNE